MCLIEQKMVKCIYCKKEIKSKEKRVRVTTFFEDKNKTNEWFHFNCWREFFKKSTLERIDKAKEKALNNLMGGFNKLLDGINKDIKNIDEEINIENY